MIGDPSGKSLERGLLDDSKIAENLRGMTQVISRFLDLNSAKVVNNADWFKGVSYIDFLRDVGKHFTVNHMMAKESIRARLEDREHGISYTEFSYMLLQAYDFYFLNQNHGCRLQIGGSDQWGNITAGIELIRRMHASQSNPATASSAEVFGLTHPLVSKSDGTKFGKTEQGTIWLDADKTSPYQFYQFFVQTADADVMQYLRFFTFLSHSELDELEESVRKNPEKREAQIRLAREVTHLVHGGLELDRAVIASQALFGDSIRELDEKTLMDLLRGAPKTEKSREALSGQGLPLIDLLVETGLLGSKGAARKEIAAGGVYLNNERITDPSHSLKLEHLIAGSHLVIRKGKKNYHLVSFR